MPAVNRLVFVAKTFTGMPFVDQLYHLYDREQVMADFARIDEGWKRDVIRFSIETGSGKTVQAMFPTLAERAVAMFDVEAWQALDPAAGMPPPGWAVELDGGTRVDALLRAVRDAALALDKVLVVDVPGYFVKLYSGAGPRTVLEPAVVSGFAASRRVADADCDAWPGSARVAPVLELPVDPAWRGRGRVFRGRPGFVPVHLPMPWLVDAPFAADGYKGRVVTVANSAFSRGAAPGNALRHGAELKPSSGPRAIKFLEDESSAVRTTDYDDLLVALLGGIGARVVETCRDVRDPKWLRALVHVPPRGPSCLATASAAHVSRVLVTGGAGFLGSHTVEWLRGLVAAERGKSGVPLCIRCYDPDKAWPWGMGAILRETSLPGLAEGDPWQIPGPFERRLLECAICPLSPTLRVDKAMLVELGAPMRARLSLDCDGLLRLITHPFGFRPISDGGRGDARPCELQLPAAEFSFNIEGAATADFGADLFFPAPRAESAFRWTQPTAPRPPQSILPAALLDSRGWRVVELLELLEDRFRNADRAPHQALHGAFDRLQTAALDLPHVESSSEAGAASGIGSQGKVSDSGVPLRVAIVRFTRRAAELNRPWLAGMRDELRGLVGRFRTARSSNATELPRETQILTCIVWLGDGVPLGAPWSPGKSFGLLKWLVLQAPRWGDRVHQFVGTWSNDEPGPWKAEPRVVRDYFDWALGPLGFAPGFAAACRADVAAGISEHLRALASGDYEARATRLFVAGLARRIAAFHAVREYGFDVSADGISRTLWITHDALVCAGLHRIPRAERDRLDTDLSRLGGLLPSLYFVLDGFDALDRRGA
ncbi:MAG TPA: hypothetical protein VGO40_00840, partial [Longimicrobium sp.]|nr:hypothetical protein [Longimicrobium sp.]